MSEAKVCGICGEKPVSGEGALTCPDCWTRIRAQWEQQMVPQVD